MRIGKVRILLVLVVVVANSFYLAVRSSHGAEEPFQVMEATIEDVHRAYKSGGLTAQQLVQMYLDRIEAYDQQGPKIARQQGATAGPHCHNSPNWIVRSLGSRVKP